MKLDPRAHIGYLVGYDSTNIYRIWIPHKGVVISTQDVIFDEKTFFDGKRTDLSNELIDELDTLIKKIKLPEPQAMNEAILEEDEDILEPAPAATDEAESDDDRALAEALEDAYLTPPPTDEDEGSPYSFHVQYPIDVSNMLQQGRGKWPTTRTKRSENCTKRLMKQVQ